MPKVFRIDKHLVCKVCRKSIVLASKRRIKCKRVVDDRSCWIVMR